MNIDQRTVLAFYDASNVFLGSAVFIPKYGWKFHAADKKRRPTRKLHSTWDKCLPWWLDLNSTSSHYLVFHGQNVGKNFRNFDGAPTL